jgi:hypothetical protein
VHISSARGIPKGYHAPSIVRHYDDVVACRQEPSSVCSRYVRDHNACLVQGTKCPRPNLASKDLPYYDDNDLDNHG